MAIRKSEDLSEPSDQAGPSHAGPRVWLPASQFGHGGFKVSVVWLERGEAYGLVQIFNPGPSVLAHLQTGVEMKARVQAFGVIQAQLDRAGQERDPVAAAQSLRAFHRQSFYQGTRASIAALGRMGEDALPALRRLLGDRTLPDWHSDIISATVAAGGVDAAPDLSAIVQEGLDFWRERLPTLEQGWWNKAPDNERRGLRNRYKRLLAALRALGPLKYAPCRQVVSELRDLWQSDDSLSEVGDNQVPRACTAVLEGLSLLQEP